MRIPVARPVMQPAAGDAFLLSSSTRRSAVMDVLLFAAMIVLFELSVGAVWALISDVRAGGMDAAAGEASGGFDRALLPLRLAVRAFGCVIIVAVILRLRGQTAASAGVRLKPLGLNALIGVGVLIAVCMIVYPTMLTLQLIWPVFREGMVENAKRIGMLVPRLHPGGLAVMMLLVGVYEEFAFRGFIMTRLRRAVGGWTGAVLLSTAVFAGLHSVDQTWAALVPVVILSLAFSLVTIWRRSIIPAIVAHMLFNLIQLIGLFYLSSAPVA